MTILIYSYNWGIKPYPAMGYLTQCHSPQMVVDLLLLGFATLYPTYFIRCRALWILGFAVLYPTYFYPLSCVFNNGRTCRHVTCRLGRAARNPTKSAASQVALCFFQPAFLFFAAFIRCGMRLEWPVYCIKKKIIKASR